MQKGSIKTGRRVQQRTTSISSKVIFSLERNPGTMIRVNIRKSIWLCYALQQILLACLGYHMTGIRKAAHQNHGLKRSCTLLRNFMHPRQIFLRLQTVISKTLEVGATYVNGALTPAIIISMAKVHVLRMLTSAI